MNSFTANKYLRTVVRLSVTLSIPMCVSYGAHAQSYELQPFLTLQDVVSDLNSEGYTDLATSFTKSGFHPDGIKVGRAGTATQGNLYVSSIATGSVLEVTPDGKAHPYVNPPPKGAQAYGTFVDTKGDLFIAYQKALSKVGGVNVVLAGTPTPTDGKACYAIPNATVAVNDLVVTKDTKTLYFTDSAGGRIFKCGVTLGADSVGCSCNVWLQSSNTKSLLGLFGGVDGLVLDSAEKNLYFDDYLQGIITKVGINADGSPGTETVLSSTYYGNTDGMAPSADGSAIYTTVFKSSGGGVSDVLTTNVATGATSVLISESPWSVLNPGASITVDTDNSIYISATDLTGLLRGYQKAGTNGGQVVKATVSAGGAVSDRNKQ